jgi:hypothetical protein
LPQSSRESQLYLSSEFCRGLPVRIGLPVAYESALLSRFGVRLAIAASGPASIAALTGNGGRKAR